MGMSVTPSMGTVSSLGSASVTWDTLVPAALTVSNYPAVRTGSARRVLSVGVWMAGQACSATLLSVTRTVRGTMGSVPGQASVSVREVTVVQTALSAALYQAASM